jgi:aldose sugar dehydrogenase
MIRSVLASIVALAIAVVAGTVVQTQFNLAALAGLGVAVPLGTRLAATLHDLRMFAPVYALVLLLPMLTAFVVARRLARERRRWRAWVYAGACAFALAVLLMIVNWLPAMPSLIVAARTLAGIAALAVTAGLGGWVYAQLTGASG